MIVRVNGEPRDVPPSTLRELVLSLGFRVEGVAVAVDDEVVPRAKLGDRPVLEGQRIEVIRAVGGG